MDTFKIVYTLLGGLGIFFYGMKSMSDALQAIAGDMIRKIINSLTANRIFAVLVGIAVTTIIQSSSVTTVMVVGFVNAGLMSLVQAIGIIFGANIGTTITGWIISIKVGKYGLLFIGMGIFPALFGKNEKWRHWGRVLFGIGMIFLGLETMSAAFKPLRSDQGFLDMISYFSGDNYGSYFASVIVGCILTMVIQSSSAMLGITIALAGSGIITFHTAAALVMGENIGTTITALLASVGGNVNAKRAARAHACFNIFAVSCLFIILPYYMDFVENLVTSISGYPGPDVLDASGDKPYIAKYIAASHSIFNITATLLFLPFVRTLAAFVVKITPDNSEKKEVHHLVHLGNANDILPATAIVQAEEELKKFKEILMRMHAMTRKYILGEDNSTKALAKIREYETITDNIQKEITLFLCIVMEKSLTSHQSSQTQALVRIADEYESVADYLERITNYHARFKEQTDLTGETREDFMKFFDEVWDYFLGCSNVIDESEKFDIEVSFRKSEKIRVWADDLRDKHIERVSKGEQDPLSSLTYSDMVVALRKLRAHALNVAEAGVVFRSPS